MKKYPICQKGKTMKIIFPEKFYRFDVPFDSNLDSFAEIINDFPDIRMPTICLR